MLAVGRALLLNGSLVMMDEPSEGLAPTIVDTLIEAVRRLVAEGVAVLVVEQNLYAATNMAERVLVMVAGRIEAETTAPPCSPTPTSNAATSASTRSRTHDATDQRGADRLEVHGPRALQRWATVGHFFDVDPLPVMTPGVRPQRRRARRVRRPLGLGEDDDRLARGGGVRRGRPRRHGDAEQRPRRAGDRRPRGGQARRLREAARRDAGRRRGDGRRGRLGDGLDLRLVQLPPGAGGRPRPPTRRRGGAGRIYHVRAAYLQSWGGPDTPLLWRFQGDVAGSGAHGDLNAHIIDMVRFVTGEEIVTIEGSIEHTFVTERTVIEGGAGGEIAGAGAQTTGGNGAEHGRRRRAVPRPHERRRAGQLRGRRGWPPATTTPTASRSTASAAPLRFDFERMNELGFYDATGTDGRRDGRRSTSPAAATATPTPRRGGRTATGSATSTGSSTRPPTSSPSSAAAPRSCRCPTSPTR